MTLQDAQFFRAETDPAKLPISAAEIIFVGRSNVGKSSVINALCQRKNLARTSKTPGRTRSINIYSAAMGKWLIDLPGYGFARASQKDRDQWKQMIVDCIVRSNGAKKVVCVIIDAFVGPTPLDESMILWLKENKIEFNIIANKCDKLPKALTSKEIAQKIAEIFEVECENIFCTSAKDRKSFDKLREKLSKFLKI